MGDPPLGARTSSARQCSYDVEQRLRLHGGHHSIGNEVRQIAELGREVYLGDAFLARRAMERCLQNIGEAAAHLSGHVRSGYPDIPWSDIVG